MANPVTVEIKGLKELQVKLEALQHNVAKKGVRQALKVGGTVIKNAMQGQAPDRTGFLQQNINTRISMRRDDLAGSVFIGPSKALYPKHVTERVLRETLGLSRKAQKAFLKDKQGRISVVSVARFLEFGTTKMSKHPFIVSAFKSASSRALDAIIVALKTVVAGGG